MQSTSKQVVMAVVSSLVMFAVRPAVAQTQRCEHLPAVAAASAVPNDNRVTSGTLANGVLTLFLVAERASWWPDGPDGCTLQVNAFAEEGKAAQIPGPLIRVAVGTEVRARIRNALPDTIWLRGLHDRDGRTIEQMTVAPGEVHEVSYTAREPGTFFYWGAFAPNGPGWTASNEFSTLVGAIVVDPPGGSVDDRIFLLIRWTNNRGTTQTGFELNAINGLSWPHTERLTLTQGTAVRWRVINASNSAHAMHLHGFYFLVTSRGLPRRDSTFTQDQRQRSVTEFMSPGRSLSLEWTPQEPGNWIFHCHMVRHMAIAQRLDRMPGAKQVEVGSHSNHATDGMSGLIVGITVQASPAVAVTGGATQPRRIRLFANMRDRVFGDRPGYGFVAQEDASEPAPDSIRIPGTPLLLERGEPVAVTIINRLPRPISVHWHGIELESYADGVADWSGTPGRIAPPIPPADSFIAQFTPPRAGTFIYHVHMESKDELSSGLYGPLLVLEPGARFDPDSDKILVIGDAVPGTVRGDERPPFVNGTTTPDTMTLIAGRTYRLRLIGISADDSHLVRLLADTAVVTWRPIARHGADLPSVQHTLVAAREVLMPGSTFDFELTPTAPGMLTLSIDPMRANTGQPAGTPTSVPIRVVAP